MAFQNQNECTVPECNGQCSEGTNLCERHRVKEVVIGNEAGSGALTIWYAEHDNQFGLIVLNDSALESQFGGAAGFEARLMQQGFTNVKNTMTQEKFDFTSLYATTGPGNWSGPWSTEYPWESAQK
jgi:hypothetical protein